MRKFALLAASSAGALFSIAVAVPNQVEADDLVPHGTARKSALLRTIDDVDMIRTSETVY